MDEYISREAAVEKITFLCELREILCVPDDEFLRGLKNALNAVKSNEFIPSADVQPVNQWISVDDRLPSIDERVFVYIPRPDDHYNIEMAYISEGDDDYPYWVLRDKSQFYSTRFHYISHWQPLPEPPKDGETE